MRYQHQEGVGSRIFFFLRGVALLDVFLNWCRRWKEIDCEVPTLDNSVTFAIRWQFCSNFDVFCGPSSLGRNLELQFLPSTLNRVFLTCICENVKKCSLFKLANALVFILFCSFLFDVQLTPGVWRPSSCRMCSFAGRGVHRLLPPTPIYPYLVP